MLWKLEFDEGYYRIYDVIAEIQTENQEEFAKAIATIRKLSRVVSTMTLNVTNPE